VGRAARLARGLTETTRAPQRGERGQPMCVPVLKVAQEKRGEP
jgi:hypothetical protein